MGGLKTSYEFTLPRGYIDSSGRLHRTGTMRLATARDELDPLRDPAVTGPEDPRLTILVLSRVVERLGEIDYVTAHEIEGLFAVDLAYLQDFYGVINFGSQEEYEELVRSAEQTTLLGGERPATAPEPADGTAAADDDGEPEVVRPPVRSAVEEMPRRTGPTEPIAQPGL